MSMHEKSKEMHRLCYSMVEEKVFAQNKWLLLSWDCKLKT